MTAPRLGTTFSDLHRPEGLPASYAAHEARVLNERTRRNPIFAQEVAEADLERPARLAAEQAQIAADAAVLDAQPMDTEKQVEPEVIQSDERPPV